MISLVFLNFAPSVFARDGDGLRLEPRKTIAYDPGGVEPLGRGDVIPFGTLRSMEGRAVDLEGLLRGKETVLLFYQGGWSPSANAQLDQLEGVVPALTNMGFQVIAISPDQPSQLEKTFAQHHLHYRLFCDRTMEVARRFGVAYRRDPGFFKKAGIRLEDYTGNSRYVLPVPAVFGIDPKGVIQFAYFNADPSMGFNVQALLGAARDMMAGEASPFG